MSEYSCVLPPGFFFDAATACTSTPRARVYRPSGDLWFSAAVTESVKPPAGEELTKKRPPGVPGPSSGCAYVWEEEAVAAFRVYDVFAEKQAVVAAGGSAGGRVVQMTRHLLSLWSMLKKQSMVDTLFTKDDDGGKEKEALADVSPDTIIGQPTKCQSRQISI